MKIVAAVPVRNRENFIGAYLDMLYDFGVEPIVSFGVKSWVNHASDESELPDLTEDILDKYFPNTKIVKGIFSHHRDSINACLRIAGGYDLMLVNDCDMFITRSDWEEFLRFVNENWEDYHVYSSNFQKMFIEYSYDYRFGKAAAGGGDYPIIGMKKEVEFRHMTKTSSDDEIVWDVEGPKFHHMRFCKKNREDRRCEVPNNITDYSPAPQEIIDRLTKWEEIINKLKQ